MPRSPRSAAGALSGTRRLAFTLATVSGFVDGVAVALVAGVFVSFMSGNTTSAAVALAQGAWSTLALSAAPIPLYVAGTVIGAAVVRRRAQGRAIILVAVAVVLTAFAVLRALLPLPTVGAQALTLVLLVTAMAMMNTVLRSVAGASVGLGYVTGTLVSLGEALAGPGDGPWRPSWSRGGLYAGLWLCFFAGAALGALGVGHIGAWAVLLPAAAIGAILVRGAARAPRATLDR